MNSFETEPDYWFNFWNNNAITNNEDLQKQVGRTINKEPVNPEIWTDTLKEIFKIIQPGKDDEILDLCSGNGLTSIPLANQCLHVTAVDVSAKLLDKIDTNKYTNITKIKSDLRTVQFKSESFSKAILYFALQHFTERETILLSKSIYNWLRPNGILFIGDIPDADRIFDYFSNQERQKAYFDSIISQKPAIGTWFTKSFFEKLSGYIGFKKCVIIEQPSFQFNGHYRFDVLFEK